MTSRALVPLAALLFGVTVHGAAAAGPRTFVVNATRDAVDAHPGDGVCRTARGDCTLRAAVMEANASPGRDRVRLPAGTYRLSIPTSNALTDPVVLTGTGDDATGDLNVLESLDIQGAGARSTIIRGSGVGEVFSVSRDVGSREYVPALAPVTDHPTASFGLTDVTLTGGAGTLVGGGAVLNLGHAVFRRVTLTHNTTGGAGGAVFNGFVGWMELYDSTVTYNTAASGGGIRFDNGGLVQGSTIAYNRLTEDCAGGRPTYDGNPSCEGGGLHVSGFYPFTLAWSTVIGNHAVIGGGGIALGMDYLPDVGVHTPLLNGPANLTEVTLIGSVIAGNTSTRGNAQCKHAGTPRILSGGHNLASDRTCSASGPGDLVGSPLLGALGRHGGQVDVFVPASGSPLVDHGGTSCPRLDARGARRPAGRACDIGAVEAR